MLHSFGQEIPNVPVVKVTKLLALLFIFGDAVTLLHKCNSFFPQLGRSQVHGLESNEFGVVLADTGTNTNIGTAEDFHNVGEAFLRLKNLDEQQQLFRCLDGARLGRRLGLVKILFCQLQILN